LWEVSIEMSSPKPSPDKRAGREGNRRGKENEQLVLLLLQSSKPKWCRHLRLGTVKEDHDGMDIIITTKYGDIPLQVKSSQMQLRRFHTKRKRLGKTPIAGVYCRDRADDIIRDEAWKEVKKHASFWIGHNI
jgi:hypothetical protein